MIELDVALPNGLVFLMDVASGQVPEWLESPVFSTGSCIAVKALHGQERNVRIVLERVSAQGRTHARSRRSWMLREES